MIFSGELSSIHSIWHGRKYRLNGSAPLPSPSSRPAVGRRFAFRFISNQSQFLLDASERLRGDHAQRRIGLRGILLHLALHLLHPLPLAGHRTSSEPRQRVNHPHIIIRVFLQSILKCRRAYPPENIRNLGGRELIGRLVQRGALALPDQFRRVLTTDAHLFQYLLLLKPVLVSTQSPGRTVILIQQLSILAERVDDLGVRVAIQKHKVYFIAYCLRQPRHPPLAMVARII